MRVRILQQAGDWQPGVHDVPEHQALKLITTGYAKAIRGEGEPEREAPKAAGPNAGGPPAEAASVAHGPSQGRQGQAKERR